MEPNEMRRIFDVHREAEARRDFDGIIATFTDDCFIETVALGIRTEGREATRAAYVGYFSAFPDLTPTDEGFAYGDNVLVSWGHLNGTSGGEWLGLPPTGGRFRVPFTNVATFTDVGMRGETLYFDLAMLCEQAGLPLEGVRAAAASRRASTGGG